MDNEKIKKISTAEENEIFRLLFQNAHDMIVYLDMRGRIIDANNRIEDIFGHKIENSKGKLITQLGEFKIKNSSPLQTFKFILDLIVSGKTINLMEFETKDKTGKKIFMEASTTLIEDGGKKKGYLAIVRDVTKRKEAENALTEKNIELEMFKNTAVGRELKMIELKKEIEKLKSDLEKYKSQK